LFKKFNYTFFNCIRNTCLPSLAAAS